MSRTMGQLADDLVNVIGFGIDQAKALEWLNARNKTMVARGLGLVKTLTLPATDGSGAVELPDEVVEVIRVRIDGKRFDIAARDSVEDLRASVASIASPDAGVYAAESGATGTITLQTYPLMDVGKVVTVLAAVRPDDLTADLTPTVPDEFADALVEGAAATGYAYDPEQTSVADRYEARFDARCLEYARWVRKRGRGAGTRQIRVQGFNA